MTYVHKSGREVTPEKGSYAEALVKSSPDWRQKHKTKKAD